MCLYIDTCCKEIAFDVKNMCFICYMKLFMDWICLTLMSIPWIFNQIHQTRNEQCSTQCEEKGKKREERGKERHLSSAPILKLLVQLAIKFFLSLIYIYIVSSRSSSDCSTLDFPLQKANILGCLLLGTR